MKRLLLLLLPVACQAAIIYTIDQSNYTVTPGSVFSITATIQNTFNETIGMNGVFNLPPGFTIDTSHGVDHVGIPIGGLNPGETKVYPNLWYIAVPTAISPGLYNAFVGATSLVSGQGVEVHAPFTITVVATPEPSTLLLVPTALGLLALRRRR